MVKNYRMPRRPRKRFYKKTWFWRDSVTGRKIDRPVDKMEIIPICINGKIMQRGIWNIHKTSTRYRKHNTLYVITNAIEKIFSNMISFVFYCTYLCPLSPNTFYSFLWSCSDRNRRTTLPSIFSDKQGWSEIPLANLKYK